MSTITVSSDLASALAAYRTQQDRRGFAALIKLTLPNSKERAWLLDTMRCDAPDTYGASRITGLVFAQALALERKAHSFFRPLAPTQTKLTVVVSVLQALEAREAREARMAGLFDEMAKAFQDGRVLKACDSVKACLAAEAQGAEGDSFVEFVFKAIKQLVKEHADFTNPKSYVPNLAQRIQDGITTAAGTCGDEPDSTAIAARQLAQEFHRMCFCYGLIDNGSAFSPAYWPPSATHTLNGVRNAFDRYSVQAVVAFMVNERADHWFGTSNLDPRLANLLLSAIKSLTGSTRAYEPHEISEHTAGSEPAEPAEPAESRESAESAETDEATTHTEHPARKRVRVV